MFVLLPSVIPRSLHLSESEVLTAVLAKTKLRGSLLFGNVTEGVTRRCQGPTVAVQGAPLPLSLFTGVLVHWASVSIRLLRCPSILPSILLIDPLNSTNRHLSTLEIILGRIERRLTNLSLIVEFSFEPSNQTLIHTLG